MNHPEHSLQILVHKWTRNHIANPHFFFGMDRSKVTSQFSHVREKSRGIVAGLPDTVLIVPGKPTICVELKAPGGKPTDFQLLVRDKLLAAGAHWDWCDSVSGYAHILDFYGVRLEGLWKEFAEASDRTLAEARTKAKAARPAPKKRDPRYMVSRGTINRLRKAGIDP